MITEIKSQNNGVSVDVCIVKIGRDGEFEQLFDIRDNDVGPITLKPRC